MLADVLQKKLSSIKSKGLFRQLDTSIKLSNSRIVYKNGQKLISFACNDYMDLANHYLVKKAAIDAINLYGVGVCASRLITGNHILYKEIEEKLTKLYGTEAALVFSSGYLTNLGIISSLVNRQDMILADKLIHASSIDGIKLSQATLYRFLHNDIDHCQELLNKYRKLHKHCLIIIENIYGMDGDLASVDDFIKLSKKYNAWIIVDTAHGFGQVTNLTPDIYVGTLSKITGALGGYICSSKIVIEYIINKARSFIYTTAIPPMIVAAASSAIDIINKNKYIPINFARIFCKSLGLPEPQSNIVPLIMKDINAALNAEQILAKKGFLVTAIRPPTSPTPRLRFTFSTKHRLSDIQRLCKVLKEEQILDQGAVAQ
ncbi:8-amino-7-oxononanoate synthase [Neoehrlichia mikurensis]|uniref:8-amino-7-oxononanoate synthase n=1 Tax=Neoehrlichia mikurensis TaxID=89586 RepID=A0A9Q9BU06_9RICK|nr:8-amino-7-oxononanoate synthase [Neoehrlichia mikurensis]QXK92162.1 8-amino-7-oxononanoate synthase [Neoehrlichia mikurensis]QXK92617.1 8-amino-7-oxononanoate synthase [Neoehrlichia mikurensis]QXK93856.1 8-amino-7-oxononanoate synthase [Neoehrlichia mikurensis]UTO55148.1 8-amino-7-oxononanoate synthase [Neoehrlichia mikurensis]UTO56069.1 8-amino-7-oxononanoate synthase [Neoehrlichia mikurensis]